MRPLRTFKIEPNLPQKLKPLIEIANNFWWCWNAEAMEVFRRLDPEKWEESYHNPRNLLGIVSQETLVKKADDAGFIAHLQRVYSQMQAYMKDTSWWSRNQGKPQRPEVAYFSAEFGIAESLPIYSGGLGILAGDHLKSASDLDVPLVAVGLLYQQGYFRQRLNAEGWQLELYPRNDFYNMALEQVNQQDGTPLKIGIAFPDRTIQAYVWKVNVGRVSLYLLDTNLEDNSQQDRQITAQLYGGDQEMRIKQEIILGVGGVHLLRAVGIEPKCFHMNEGHSAFLSLERIRHIMAINKVPFSVAREIVAASNVFTTHTPVPAGNDAFAPWLIEKYLSNYWKELNLTKEEFLKLGHSSKASSEDPFNLTIFAINMSKYHNGVSELHGQVSRDMWANIWPALPENEIPIDGLVNGIHIPTWISKEIATLFDRYIGPGWRDNPENVDMWDAVRQIPDSELWRTHERRRERLVAFARSRMVNSLTKRGASASEIKSATQILDPEALTIGFARRFATYKRANLLLADLERLRRILKDKGQKVQFIFAGKAHPKDKPGKDLIRHIVQAARDEDLKNSFIFLEDYDMNVARYMVQGVDVWLNTPLRPLEASGTSGMKAAANGALNCSIPDGWWAEGYHPSCGWSIGAGESYDDLGYQNQVESRALYDLLEKDIIPTFYDRGQDNLPTKWIAMMKETIARLAPVFNTNRMVQNYSERYYMSAIKNWNLLSAHDLKETREIREWKNKIAENFKSVKINSVTDCLPKTGASVGKPFEIEASVNIGLLEPSDISVELYFGEIGDDGQIVNGQSLAMEPTELTGKQHKYRIALPCAKSGYAGYTVRIIPNRKTMDDTQMRNLVCWAGL